MLKNQDRTHIIGTYSDKDEDDIKRKKHKTHENAGYKPHKRIRVRNSLDTQENKNLRSEQAKQIEGSSML